MIGSDKSPSRTLSNTVAGIVSTPADACRLVIIAFAKTPDIVIEGAFGSDVLQAVQACRLALRTEAVAPDEAVYLPCRPVSPTESIEVRNRMTVLVGNAMRELWQPGGKPPTTAELCDRIATRVLALVVNVPGRATER